MSKRIYSQKIKGLRVLKGFSQRDVSKRLGMSLSTYSVKENGNYAFTIYEALDLAKILEVSVDDIFL